MCLTFVAGGTHENFITMKTFHHKVYTMHCAVAMNQHAQPDRTTPLQSTWSMVLSAMTVECKEFIYLFIYLFIHLV